MQTTSNKPIVCVIACAKECSKTDTNIKTLYSKVETPDHLRAGVINSSFLLFLFKGQRTLIYISVNV